MITHTKAVFARHGIPSVVRSDNGPQYSATEYKQFSKSWGFTHITTSPYHSQSNGLAEKSVQILKCILNKAKQGGTDPYLSLLEYRNTTIDNVGSPAQLSMSRQLRSVLPVTSQHLDPAVIEPSVVIERLKQRQTLRKGQYDKGAKTLPTLQPKEPVRMQVQGHWIPAVVVREASTPHSYIVQTRDGRNYRRNRKHLHDFEIPAEPGTSNEPNEPGTLLPTLPPPERQTRGGRTVRLPVRYQDFVRL